MPAINHLVTDNCSDLARFYDDEFNLCVWTPTPDSERETYARLLAQENFQFKQVVSNQDPMAAFDSFPDGTGSAVTKEWIGELIDIFATLFGLNQVGLRISSVSKPMCPKFHADHIPARMVHALHGDGSEWVNDNLFESGESNENYRELIKKFEIEDSKIERAPAGSVALMKGTGWKDHIPPVIHRSPMHHEKRVVMTLDFT